MALSEVAVRASCPLVARSRQTVRARTLSRHAEPNGRQRLVREGFRTQRCVSSRLALVPGAEHVAATKSAYYIQTMQPDLVIAAVRGRCGPPGLFGGRHPGSSLAVAEPACAVRSRCGGPWNSYARRAASHSLAKILDSRIERVGGIDRSRRAGDLELIRIAAHDRAAIDEAVEHERKAAPGEQFRPVKQAEMQMRGGGVAGVAELADSIPPLTRSPGLTDMLPGCICA
jgi:hypothetical protein